MAARQAFLAREPARSPKGPKRASPVKKPPVRRAPGKRPRDPRVIPPRPAPKKPAPRVPLFEPSPKRMPKPFGIKPAHIPASPLAPFRRAPLQIARRILPRLLPGLGWALLASDLYDLWQWWRDQVPGDDPLRQQTCNEVEEPHRRKVYDWRRFPGCFTFQPVTHPGYDVIPARTSNLNRWLFQWQQGGTGVPSSTRFNTLRCWDYGNIPVGSVPNPFPVDRPVPMVPMPEDNPYPYPFAPEPFPFHPPLVRPRPLPEPPPIIRPLPGVGGPVIPSRDLSPDGPVAAPGRHEVRPPDGTEREKKKRMSPGASFKIYKFLNKYGGSYMELDDAVAAVYKGLPWKLRRWRGRDGVWRDRDHTSASRLKRLYSSLGQLDVEKAMIELVKDQVSDYAFGKAGNVLKNRTRELGDEGLWSGSRGLGAGTPLNSHDEEARKKLIRDAAKKEPKRWYRVREQQADGSWRSVLKERPVMQIPWYRRQSMYPRMARRGEAEFWSLTAAEKAAKKKTVGRTYYSPLNVPRPFIRNP